MLLRHRGAGSAANKVGTSTADHTIVTSKLFIKQLVRPSSPQHDELARWLCERCLVTTALAPGTCAAVMSMAAVTVQVQPV